MQRYQREMSPPSGDRFISGAASVSSRRTIDTARTSRTTPMTDAEEAELISRATSQAMIAAKSILLSGGSESTALSTAKAAAASILVPNTSEIDGPSLGKMFLSRRKAKRQAEVVASMALLSVKQQTLLSSAVPMGHTESFVLNHPPPPSAPKQRTNVSTPASSGRASEVQKFVPRHIDQKRYSREPEHGRSPQDLTAGEAPMEDPIYSASVVAPQPRAIQSTSIASSGTESEDSRTYESGSNGDHHAGHSDITQTRSNTESFLTEVDPILSTITGIFTCGRFGAMDIPDVRPRSKYVDSRNDYEDGRGSDSDGEEDYVRSKDKPGRVKEASSKSTADSEQLLRELNLSSEDEDAKIQTVTPSPRATLQQSVLRALSLDDMMQQQQQNPTTEYRDRVTIAVQPHKGGDTMSTTSSLTSTHRSRLQALSQRVKFRNWMSRRKRKGVPSYAHNE